MINFFVTRKIVFYSGDNFRTPLEVRIVGLEYFQRRFDVLKSLRKPFYREPGSGSGFLDFLVVLFHVPFQLVHRIVVRFDIVVVQKFDDVFQRNLQIQPVCDLNYTFSHAFYRTRKAFVFLHELRTQMFPSAF